MAEGRAIILARVRDALGRGAVEGGEAQVLQGPERPIRYTRPAHGVDPIELFAEKIRGAAGTLARVASVDEVPAAVSAYLDEKGLPPRIAVAPALQGLAWPEGWEVRYGASQGEDRVGVTPCFAAVAETGTLALLSGPDSPTSLNFLPGYHLVVVRFSQVVSYLEVVWERLRVLPGGMPRTVNLITGPSRTADVEQTLQLGAHGPLCLHVILVAA